MSDQSAEAIAATDSATAGAAATPVVPASPEIKKPDVDQISSLADYRAMTANLPSEEEFQAQQVRAEQAAAQVEQPAGGDGGEQAPAAGEGGEQREAAGSEGGEGGEEQPVAGEEGAPQGGGEGDGKAANRIRIGQWSEVDREAALIKARNPDMGLADALKQAEKKLGVTQPETPAGAEQQPQGQQQQGAEGGLPKTLEEAQAKTDDLATQLAAAQKALDFDKASELQGKLIQSQRDERLVARNVEQQTAQQGREFAESISTSKAKAVEYYPDVTKADSPLAVRMGEIDATLKATGNPLFNSPDKYLKVAQMAANDLGIAPKSKSSPVVTKPAVKPAVAPARQQSAASPVVQPKPQPPIAGGRARTPQTSVSATLDGVLDQVKTTDDWEKIKGELSRLGTH